MFVYFSCCLLRRTTVTSPSTRSVAVSCGTTSTSRWTSTSSRVIPGNYSNTSIYTVFLFSRLSHGLSPASQIESFEVAEKVIYGMYVCSIAVNGTSPAALTAKNNPYMSYMYWSFRYMTTVGHVFTSFVLIHSLLLSTNKYLSLNFVWAITLELNRVKWAGGNISLH